MTRGPKPKSRAKLLSAMLGFDVELALANFPDEPISQCWDVPTSEFKVTEDGKRRKLQVARSLFEIGLNELLSPDWHVVRKPNCGSRQCVNPTHHRLKMHNFNRLGSEPPLPFKLLPQTADHTEEVQEIGRHLDNLQEDWGRKQITRDEFVTEMKRRGYLPFEEAALDEVFK